MVTKASLAMPHKRPWRLRRRGRVNPAKLRMRRSPPRQPLLRMRYLSRATDQQERVQVVRSRLRCTFVKEQGGGIHGNRNREVVQRLEGLRLHLAGRRRRRRLRSLQRERRRGLQEPHRRREGRVRGRRGPERPAGPQRQHRRLTRISRAGESLARAHSSQEGGALSPKRSRRSKWTARSSSRTRAACTASRSTTATRRSATRPERCAVTESRS